MALLDAVLPELLPTLRPAVALFVDSARRDKCFNICFVAYWFSIAVNGVLINNYRYLLHQPDIPLSFVYYLLHLLTEIYRRKLSRQHLRRQKTSLYLDSLRLLFTVLHNFIYQICKYRLSTASADKNTQKKIIWSASSQTENQP